MPKCYCKCTDHNRNIRQEKYHFHKESVNYQNYLDNQLEINEKTNNLKVGKINNKTFLGLEFCHLTFLDIYKLD